MCGSAAAEAPNNATPTATRAPRKPFDQATGFDGVRLLPLGGTGRVVQTQSEKLETRQGGTGQLASEQTFKAIAGLDGLCHVVRQLGFP
jgi:hypothetical protein